MPRAEVGGVTAAAMHDLLRRHFDAVDEAQFRADLAEKDWVVLLEDGAGRLVGFSTLLLYPERLQGERVTVVCSGDTIVDPTAWTSPALARTWIRAVRALHASRGSGRLWWLLIASGFRTYRFLSVFCRDFHPRHDGAPAGRLGEVADHLARRRFRDAYDPARGIVRFSRPQRLRGELAGIPPGRLRDPHVAFFARANPGHAAGDELVCVAELGDANLTAAGLRMLRGAAARSAPAEALA